MCGAEVLSRAGGQTFRPQMVCCCRRRSGAGGDTASSTVTAEQV